MYRLIDTSRFQRNRRRFERAHPELRSRITQTLVSLQADPFQPRLRLHPLEGEMKDFHAVSLTYRYRITLILRISEHEIELIDIGTHDEV